MSPENRPAGTVVGSRVTATDIGTHSNNLEYGVPSDNAYFSIDKKTGQLRTKAALDHEDSAFENGVNHDRGHGRRPVRFE